MPTQNNKTPMLPQDEEGITGGAEKQPYYVETAYTLAHCYTSAEYARQEPNPEYKDPSDPDYDPDNPQDEYITVTDVEFIGIYSDATLQEFLGKLEENGCKLYKRKVTIVDDKPHLGWQPATATDFELIETSQLTTMNDSVAFKAIDDEVFEMLKQGYPEATDASIWFMLSLFGMTGLRIEHDSGVLYAKAYHFEKATDVPYYVEGSLALGNVEGTLENTNYTAEISRLLFYIGD